MQTSLMLLLALSAPLEAPDAGAPAAANSDALPAPDPPASEDTGMFSTVGLFTLGGGVLGAVAAGGLVVLSPCMCGLPLACPVAAAATGAGAAIGAYIASDGDIGRACMPSLVGTGVGGAAGLLAGVLALGTAVVIDSSLPNPGLNANGAAFNVGLSSVVAGGVALVVVVAASFAAAGVTAWAFERGAQSDAPIEGADAPDEAEKKDGQKDRKKPQTPTTGDQVAMVF